MDTSLGAAAFVLTHVDDHASALTAMVNTLRPNRRPAISLQLPLLIPRRLGADALARH
jgi:hypothetical protein